MTTRMHEPAVASGGPLATWATLLFGGAILCTLIGFFTMYKYSESPSGAGHIVGADAYNYIIIAVRGEGWMVAGVVAALAGSTCALVAAIRRRSAAQHATEAPYARRPQEEIHAQHRAAAEDPRANDLR